MIKCALFAVTGVLGFCLGASAQALEPQVFDPTLGPSIQSPWPSLENSDKFFFSSAFGSMRRSDMFLPSFDPSEPLSRAYVPSSNRTNSLDRIMELDAAKRIRFGGEAGIFYGKSTGKYGREDFIRYISGTIGNEMFSISVGYLHQETTYDFPRRRR